MLKPINNQLTTNNMKHYLLFLVLFAPFLVFSQDIKLNGTVKSAYEVLPGVNVLEKGTTNGTSTDLDGNYSIKVKEGAVLVFSFLGYS